MGGERASTVRQREGGKICCVCHQPLEPPLPGHRPGFRTGERYCARHQPSPRVRLSVIGRDPVGACFSDATEPSSFTLWVLFETYAEVDAALDWLGAPSGKAQLQACFDRQWSHGSAEFELTPEKFATLRRRAEGWPWNGYELQKMREQGKYPPKRLTPAQERSFLERKRKRDGSRTHR